MIPVKSRSSLGMSGEVAGEGWPWGVGSSSWAAELELHCECPFLGIMECNYKRNIAENMC